MRAMISGLAILVLAICGGVFAEAGELHPLGAHYEPGTPGGGAGAASAAPGQDGGRTSADLTALFPPVMNQGSIGSCVSCATGYALKGYHEGVEHGWDLASSAHQFSPNYLYNQVNGGADLGSYTSDNFWVMARRGICPLSSWTYSSDYQTWPSQAQCAAGLSYRNTLIGGNPYGWLNKTDTAGIKAKLDAGIPLCFGLQVDHAWDSLAGGVNYVWYPDNASIRGWHGIAIIGYDDARTDGAGHVGAFKVQNSWGTGWGSGGYCWISYDALSTSSVWSAFYYMQDMASGYASTVSAKVSVSHAKRGAIKITVGVGSTTSPTWSLAFYDPAAMNESGDYTHANISATVDLTAAAAYWPPTAGQKWWVKVEDTVSDSVTGTITEFSVTQGTVTYSTGATLPVAIPDSGSAAYAYNSGASTPCDFTGDGRADILWREWPTTGKTVVWTMDGATKTASAYTTASAGTTWTIVGLADFTGDGKTDILWREAGTYKTVIWTMDGATKTASAYTSASANSAWAVAGVADFDGDGKADILWRDTTGKTVVWMMNGATKMASAYTSASASTGWVVAGVADFTGDGKADILWRETLTGKTVVWTMDGATKTASAYTSASASLAWEVSGVADFTGDGKADILWREASGTRKTVLWTMNGATKTASAYTSASASDAWKVAKLADFTGDGKADILWRETLTGKTVVWTMDGATKTASAYTSASASTAWVIQ
jgi:hypothetical protein